MTTDNFYVILVLIVAFRVSSATQTLINIKREPDTKSNLNLKPWEIGKTKQDSKINWQTGNGIIQRVKNSRTNPFPPLPPNGWVAYRRVTKRGDAGSPWIYEEMLNGFASWNFSKSLLFPGLLNNKLFKDYKLIA